MEIETNKMKLTILSKSCNESFARTAVGAFAAFLDPTIEELGDIKAAVSEAVTNAVVHGYPKSIGGIEIACEIKESTLYIKISDKGVGIPDIEKAMTPLFTTAPESERAGLGFAVMESFTDRLTVRSRPGKGTTVSMRKKIRQRF